MEICTSADAAGRRDATGKLSPAPEAPGAGFPTWPG